MSKKIQNAISPTRNEDYPEWYQQVIKAADLAENSAVRGCMVIKPWGYGMWENIQRILNQEIKDTGHKNAYFPLFIPLKYLQKEADHIEGFAKECAVVTHHRLKKDDKGNLIPDGKLEEPLVVRPTSEMIIGETFSKWVQSYRDLPLLINQWANVVRWEMRTRLFLRTTEFLWQEGHTVHATQEEAQEEAEKMLQVYATFSNDILAMPVITGRKTESERFPGAINTYAIEAMMQDGKALQAGTSHFLGQNFAKSCDITFRDENGDQQYGWMTSWGVATRLIGGVIMTHSDDDGLIIPPKIAPSQIVLLPVIHKESSKEAVLQYCHNLAKELSEIFYQSQKLDVIVDDSDMRGGEKKWNWIKKGIPLRCEIGPRDIENNTLCLYRRNLPHNEILHISKEELLTTITTLLDDMQNDLLQKAIDFRKKHTVEIDNKEAFYEFFSDKQEKAKTASGFVKCFFSEDRDIEEKLQKELSVTVRCIPLNNEKRGTCIFTNKPNALEMIFAKSY